MKIICTICARGGSKGVKNKNLRPVLGIPLIAHTIRHAQETGMFDIIAVSSDSEEILSAAQDAGVDIVVRRPEAMASDTAAKVPAIRHCVQNAEQQSGLRFDVCVDLDATSPLRNADDIKGSVEILLRHDASNVFSVCPAHRSPYFNMVELDEQGSVNLVKPANNLVRRQDAPICFDMNASIYVWKRDVLEDSDILFLPDTKIFEMPAERSQDIDSEYDFEVVEFLMTRRGDAA